MTTARPCAQLALVGGFRLVVGPEDPLIPPNGQRLLAFLGLRSRPASRTALSAALWPDAPERRASASLRSTLWRLARLCPTGLLVAGPTDIALHPSVEVDVHTIEREVRTLCSDESDSAEAPLDVSVLQHDLLPDWTDEWLDGQREWFRQVRLHALDALCAHHRERGRFHRALQAGIAAVTTEPLRESAHRELVALHLAEGNVAEALRQYRMFDRMLRAELGVGPSRAFHDLVAPLSSGHVPHARTPGSVPSLPIG
ncbi:AfsR/SARP family transcriptional regulator [Umezawaea beigongshangensis]|uniref:AfsR/SARP family transcriptional regulator n=1 Tax=Umezawaea beigongshangensis TaxID=2780383 RepID=UPI0018F2277B|nr:BTAD domain-containing putative transcriptional regulator [Umezawaea beigongshangensis]